MTRATARNTRPHLMQEFSQQLINGLSVGAIYALIAVGYTMVYGVLQLINFAHGDVFMVGAMLFLILARAFGFVAPDGGTNESIVAVMVLTVLAVAACGALGFTIERLAYRPLRDRPRINALITAIGISLLLEYGGQHPQVFGASPQAFPSAIVPGLREAGPTGIPGGGPPRVLFNVFGAPVTAIDGLVLGLTLVLMAGLTYVVLRTKTGLALRAVSFRFDTAALMGININRVISVAFVLGSCLAAAAGILYAIKYPRVDPLMGLTPGLKAFVAAVFGGIGNIGGAVVGGLVLGLVEAFVVGYVERGSDYRDATAFLILIVILMVKPSGLFGRHVVEKV